MCRLKAKFCGCHRGREKEEENGGPIWETATD